MPDYDVTPDLPRGLGDGLLLRHPTPADVDALADLNSTILVDPTGPCPDEGEAAWTRDLLLGGHPTVTYDDYTIVEDHKTGQIVSAMVLISQTWRYDGLEFGLGRPEQVVTRPEYRGKGLVRAQIEMLHARSAAKGEMLQGITGIPYFYRQFGYEMAVTLSGGRVAGAANIPRLASGAAASGAAASGAAASGAAEPYLFRPVIPDDAAWIAELDARAAHLSLLSCVRDEAMWRYEIAGKREKNWTRMEMRAIETPGGETLGFIGHESRMMGDELGVYIAEVRPGVSWLRIVPSLLRHLWAAGEVMASRDGKKMHGVSFGLGPEHPLYEVAPKRLSHVSRPYAWYLRVADLPGFLRHIAPVLERRIAESAVVGCSGDLKLSFYRSGLMMKLADGKLIGVEPWQPTPEDPGAAAFPALTFLQLLFGYRTIPELRESFADCWTESDEAQAVVAAMFPRRASNILVLS